MTSKTQKQLQSERTRRQIIDAAAQLFVRKGFYGTSIADLARATDLTKGALYHHFENKDALFFVVIKSVRSAWNKEVARDVVEAGDALTQLTVMLENHARLIQENDTLCLVLHGLTTEMEGVNPDFSTALQEVYADLTRFIERIVQKGQAAGQIRPDLDARLMALNFVGMLRGIGCCPVFRQMGVDHAEIIGTLNQMLLGGLRP